MSLKTFYKCIEEIDDLVKQLWSAVRLMIPGFSQRQSGTLQILIEKLGTGSVRHCRTQETSRMWNQKKNQEHSESLCLLSLSRRKCLETYVNFA